MGDYRVVITDHDFEDVLVEQDVLEDICDITVLSDEPGEPITNLDEFTSVDAILNLRSELDGELIETAEKCKIISQYGIGVDNIDIDTATKNEILVTNVPDYCVEEVATHAFTLALVQARGIGAYNESVETGGWERDVAAPIHRFSTLTVGIIGYGAIGRELGRYFSTFGTDILAYDPFLTSDDLEGGDVKLVPFDRLIETSDIVSIHVPLTENTVGMIGEDEFSRMKDSAILMNVSRGGLIEESDLLQALNEEEIAGVGLDVLEEEPPSEDNPLRSHPRAIITPHVAWYSEEANAERRQRAAKNVRAVLQHDQPSNAVNEIEGFNT